MSFQEKSSNNVSRPVLILNKTWYPIRISTVQQVIIKSMNELQYLISGDYNIYTWDEWVDKYAVDCEEESPYHCVNAVHFKVAVPEIAVCKEFSDVPKKTVRLNRKNLIVRDNGKCQYTGKKVDANTGTVDHIVPKSRGGETTWENIVLCDSEINRKKGDKTPEEYGLKLSKNPEEPNWNPLFEYIFRKKNIPESWYPFIPHEWRSE